MSSLAQSYISCKLAIRPLGLLYFTGPLFKKCIVKMMYLYQKMITLCTRMMSSYHLPLYFTFTKFMDKNSWFVKYKLPKGRLKLSVQVPKAASFISYWDQDENNLLRLNYLGVYSWIFLNTNFMKKVKKIASFEFWPQCWIHLSK